MPKGGFWTNNLTYAPKQQFAFRVYINGMALEDDPAGDEYQDGEDEALVWYVKSIDKPTITLGEMEKGESNVGSMPVVKAESIPMWSPVKMTLVDPSYPNATRKLMRLFRRAGYLDETAQGVNGTKGFNFGKLKEATGQVLIQQLDTFGAPLESWELTDAFPTEVNFGKLDYSSNDLVEISVTWAYTAAYLTSHGMGNDLGPRHGGEAMQAEFGDGQMSERSFTYQKDIATARGVDMHNPESTPGGMGG